VGEIRRSSEHAARRRDDSQLDPVGAAEEEQVLEELFAELAAGDHDPVDSPVELFESVMQCGATLDPSDDLGVDIRKELELANDRLRERALSDDEHALRRSEATPEHPHAGAEREAEAEHGSPDQQLVVRRQVERRKRHEKEGQKRRAAQCPDEQPGKLVDGQMTQRAVVAVVQTGELRRDDPDRRE
jgi:hypothetical protein